MSERKEETKKQEVEEGVIVKNGRNIPFFGPPPQSRPGGRELPVPDGKWDRLPLPKPTGKKKPKEHQFRKWCFTAWIIDQEPVWDSEFYSYMIYGLETCPDTGTLHWQGYCETATKRTESSVANFFRAHGQTKIKIIISSAPNSTAAIDYCKKGGEWKDFGKAMEQGRRTDLDEIRENILVGAQVDTIIATGPLDIGVRYSRWMDRLEDIRLKNVKRTWVTELHWFWGRTGAGKSMRAQQDAEYIRTNLGYQEYWHPLNDKGWWDGYTGQEVVILDDYRPENLQFSELLKMADRYPYRVPRRGRAPVPFLAKRLIITAPEPPHLLFGGREDIRQLLRRCTLIEEIKSPAPLPPRLPGAVTLMPTIIQSVGEPDGLSAIDIVNSILNRSRVPEPMGLPPLPVPE